MKILNFGSMNLDHVYTVPHMVTPGETLLSGGKRLFCGGKGLNQSVAIAKAGGEVYHARPESSRRRIERRWSSCGSSATSAVTWA